MANFIGTFILINWEINKEIALED